MTARRRACKTGKRSWRSQEQAKDALTLIRQSPERNDPYPTKAYRCPHCHRWHLATEAEAVKV